MTDRTFRTRWYSLADIPAMQDEISQLRAQVTEMQNSHTSPRIETSDLRAEAMHLQAQVEQQASTIQGLVFENSINSDIIVRLRREKEEWLKQVNVDTDYINESAIEIDRLRAECDGLRLAIKKKDELKRDAYNLMLAKTRRCGELQTQLDKAQEHFNNQESRILRMYGALDELCRLNPTSTRLEEYAYRVAQHGMGRIADHPNLADFSENEAYPSTTFEGKK